MKNNCNNGNPNNGDGIKEPCSLQCTRGVTFIVYLFFVFCCCCAGNELEVNISDIMPDGATVSWNSLSGK